MREVWNWVASLGSTAWRMNLKVEWITAFWTSQSTARILEYSGILSALTYWRNYKLWLVRVTNTTGIKVIYKYFLMLVLLVGFPLHCDGSFLGVGVNVSSMKWLCMQSLFLIVLLSQLWRVKFIFLNKTRSYPVSCVAVLCTSRYSGVDCVTDIEPPEWVRLRGEGGGCHWLCSYSILHQGRLLSQNNQLC